MYIDRRIRLRKRLTEKEVLMIPGTYDAIIAKIIEHMGFEAVYMTGAGTVNGLTGLPDIGLMTMSEMVDNANRIVEACNLPIICDADSGYGNAMNVIRTVREYEKAGVSAIHIEDQEFPKKCGHVEGKKVVSKEEMVGKIKAAVYARKDPNFMIIARTDALALNGFDDAVDRARAYVDAGADIIFPEALTSKELFKEFRKEVPHVPLIANMTEFGKTPYITCDEFTEMGYDIVIYAMTLFRVMMKAVYDALAQLKQDGHQKNFLDKMKTRRELYDLIDYDLYAELEKQFVPKEDMQKHMKK